MVMVGCGMRKRGIRHGSKVFDLNDLDKWQYQNTKVAKTTAKI